MRKFMVLFLAVCLVSLIPLNNAAAVEVGGYIFDDNAFPDNATYVSGEVTFWGFTPTGDLNTDLNTALTGHDLSTGISGESGGDLGYIVELDFSDNYLFNGEGSDLVVFEFGTPEPFDISIYDPVLDEWTTYLRVSPVDIDSVNVGEVEFSDWGIDSTAQITKVRISTEYWNTSWIGADISALGGLNSAPIRKPSAGKPPLKPGNPGLPGCLAEVEQLRNQALVRQTGQTTPYAEGDDGSLQMGVECPEPRFADNGDGTVTDKCTGLVWLKNANCFSTRNHADALMFCNNLANEQCGLTDGSVAGDWRLPNIRELHSLVHFGFYRPALSNTTGTSQWTEGDPFSGVVASAFSHYYWSSTSYADPNNTDYAWYVAFRDGDMYRQQKNNGSHVWCVRDGN